MAPMPLENSRKIFLVVAGGNPAAERHFEDTIQRNRNLEEVRRFLPLQEIENLARIYHNSNFIVWGAVPGPMNESRWEKMDLEIAIRPAQDRTSLDVCGWRRKSVRESSPQSCRYLARFSRRQLMQLRSRRPSRQQVKKMSGSWIGSGCIMPPRKLKPSILSSSKYALALTVDMEFWTTIKLTQPPGPSHFQACFLSNSSIRNILNDLRLGHCGPEFLAGLRRFE
jgi:hypothetical protein